MPVEIEAKMKVNDLGSIRAKLQACGAEPLSTVLETNTFFDTENRTLLARDHGLRLRHIRDSKTQGESAIITFKGPRLQGALKTREERELTVGKAKDAMALLESLGFSRILSFQKRRESWKLEGCQIELDELPHLGSFVEIEGPNEKIIFDLRQRLGLNDKPLISAGYIALMMAHLQERGINDRVVMFPTSPAKGS